MSFSGIQEVFVQLKPICAEIATEPKVEKLNELRHLLPQVPASMLQGFQEYLLFPLIVHLKGDKIKSKEDVKQNVVEAIKDIFALTHIEASNIFFEVYETLIRQIYELENTSLVANIHEEYKLTIIECFTTMYKSLSWDVLTEIYNRQHAHRFSQIIYVCLEIAKNERLRKLRLAAMECILIIARMHDASDVSDKEIQSHAADVFMLFLPRIVATMRCVALEDNKVGHKIIVSALRTWGRIITLLMQNYGAADEEIDFAQLNIAKKTEQGNEALKVQWKTEADMKRYLESSQRTPEWYKKTDAQLKPRIKALSKLQSDPHPNIRNELADVCILLVENCVRTMPESIGLIVEILLVLSEDDYENIATKCKKALSNLSLQFSSREYNALLENLQEHFFTYVTTLPTIINNSDEDKISCLNLLIGYLRLFGEQQLINIFYSHLHLKRLMMGLLYISRLNSHTVSILEEHSIQVLELKPHLRTPWKQFTHFHSEAPIVENKIHAVCSLLVCPDVFDIVTDYLLEIFLNDPDNRKEATFLLNVLGSIVFKTVTSIWSCFLRIWHIFSHGNYFVSLMISEAPTLLITIKKVMFTVKTEHSSMHIIKNIINMYTEPDNWYLPITVSAHSNETLLEVQNNVIQVCLLAEGLGKIASALGKDFQQFLLKCLYLILERAGSGIPLIQEAGLGAITNVSHACGHSNVTELFSQNTDYFSFHVIRKLKRIDENEGVLDVLAVVMKYSTMDILPYIADIVDGVLMQSFDKHQVHNINSFLRIFLIFIKCLHDWLRIQVDNSVPEDKAADNEEFRVSGINYDNNFSDDIMEGKSAQELYEEDKKESKTEDSEEQQQQKGDVDDEEEAYKKPEPPLHVKLTVSIMKRTLHFLPSRDKARKLMVIEILTGGFEVIREWEDELLPLVHQTWSPLVDRFREFEEPLVINLSFRLLITLARLSKYFIRSRTIKDVLPHINTALSKLVTNSKLKDKGSVYRYTQAYKLQLELLTNLPLLIIYLEMETEVAKTIVESMAEYLSDKQPIPLQEATVNSLNFLQDRREYASVIFETLHPLEDNKELQKNIKHILCN